ncbi:MULTISPECIES: ATP-grasp domain-containing protein [Streptomyces]|uniref:ATP-grasp domain-containing protein n=1 Tax=Streptomyces doudnae TaxID=3075536 RepID=A0ABD5EVT9_9ACTN|nr:MULTISPECIES: ATP-grasp domain-containing protein [unclassified Streptomyces]MDT0438363.1 ATP-grasp domain-containing protein [Streptomyces sp. DSM 41981]MYQ65517.1 ATP-grasp domain-containing protein [Streptomyces sp. SID4950]SCE01580.1 ATP-grasp domain-containing protein [Streptomyces sp. SolWspMP-5a-2]
MKRAILLLMHQGKSYTEEVAAATAGLGLTLVALSSRPETPEVLEASRRHVADCLVTEEPELCSADLDKAVRELAERGYQVEASLASFEGYRLLMAELNERLGAHDSAEAALRLCLDKYELRRHLCAEGLSEVRLHRLSAGVTPELDPTTDWFVKPVRGASSFATFRLKGVDDLADLPAIQEQMRADRRMKAIFMDRYDFLVEEFVDGPEFSFETVVLDGRIHHLCVHEKARVEHLERTVLEGMSVSPPVSLSRELVLEGADHVADCLASLAGHGLTAGVFHIEVKYWESKGRWEIIEINPRMGGSLINASVQTVTGHSLLDLWTESLLLPDGERDAFHARLTQASQVEALRTGALTRATVFLSKYGEKGRTVDEIRFEPPTRPPRILNVHVAAGTALDASDRGICLMDALWDAAADDLVAETAFLDRHATEHFHVRYR